MTKNNSNWKEIEEEFKKKYFHRGVPGYELRHVQMCEEFLDFFKPYFQEKMHDLSISELETVDNNPKE